MTRKALRTIVLTSFAPVVMLAVALEARAQDARAPYPNMAPLDLIEAYPRRTPVLHGMQDRIGRTTQFGGKAYLDLEAC